MTQPRTFELVAALGDSARRAQAAQALAQRLGGDELLLFLRDPDLGALVPAPGFAQTLRGGSAWREFLSTCSEGSEQSAQVDLPKGSMRPAIALARNGVVAVLLGGVPNRPELVKLAGALPLLGGLLRCEFRIALAGAEANDARESANRAQALSSALESARAEQARLNTELRDEHRRKDEFLAMLAHELRNPLSPLLTSLEIMRHRSVTQAQRDKQVEVMARQVSQLSRLVEDLLDVSRVSHGRIELKRRSIALAQVLADALEASAPLLHARRHELVLDVPPDPVIVSVDPVRMTQVFANLINNAAKYTEPGGRIQVELQTGPKGAQVRIADDGIGMDSAVLSGIFHLFAQGPVSTERAQGGLGIGLTLVRMLLELHGGSVSAHSDGLGKGSTFMVELPLAAAQRCEHPVALAKSETHLPARALRVLVVDDNRDAADSLAGVLGLMGHHAEVAYGGVKAVQLATDLEPDLVLLDIGLPELDGYEVARRLRRNAARSARLVALTGYGSDDDRRRSGEAGFDEHVVKPVDPATLIEIVARTLRGAEPGAVS